MGKCANCSAEIPADAPVYLCNRCEQMLALEMGRDGGPDKMCAACAALACADFDAGALACADCGVPCSLADSSGLHADVASGRRKVVCDSCLPGGPVVVVTVIEASPAVDVAEVLEAVAAVADDGDDVPVKAAKPVTFKVACEREGLPVRSTSHREREAVAELLLARGWAREAKVEGKRRFWWWYEPASHERHTW